MAVSPLRKGDPNVGVVLQGKLKFTLEDRHLGPLDPGDVEIRTQAVALCGTDDHLYREGHLGEFRVTSLVLGHEASGVVTRIGQNVTTLSVGDRVTMDPHIGCMTCWKCKSGRYNLCHTHVHGIPPTDGYLVQYLNHRADNCYRLEENISFEEGALIEPLSVVINACRTVKLTMTDTVLISGGGTLGLLCLMVAKACSAKAVCVIDRNPGRLELAEQLGADFVVCSDGMEAQSVSAQIVASLPDPPRVSFECSGADVCLSVCIQASRMAGSIALIGFGGEETKIPLKMAQIKGVDLLSIISSANCFPAAISMVGSGKVNLKPLISKLYTLEKFGEAMDDLSCQRVVRPVIDMR